MSKYVKYFTLSYFLLSVGVSDVCAQRGGRSGGNWSSPQNVPGLFAGGGVALLKMDGDYGSKQIGVLTSGGSLLAEYKFPRNLVLRSAITKGTLRERFTGRFSYFDHHTNIFTGEILGMFLFPDLTDCRSKIQVRPFLGVGAGLIHFKTYADLYDAQGQRYHFWEDGTVRMVPEGVRSEFDPPVVERDGVFETYIDTLGLYPNVAGKFPLEVGLRVMFNRNMGMYIAGRYTITTTDYIDHGVGFHDAYLTVRSPYNHFPDGYYTLSLSFIFRIEAGGTPGSRSPYSRKQRRPRQCGRF